LKEREEEEVKNEILPLFFCHSRDEKDETGKSKMHECEKFLKEDAVEFERRSVSRTYLLVDEEALEKEDKINIIAYYTLSMKSLNLGEDVGTTKRSKLSGGMKEASTVVAYLIGQLAKNDTYSSETNMTEILEFALSTIQEAYKIVGGRCVLVECKPSEGLTSLYENNGFKKLQKSQENDGLVQYFCYIKPSKNHK